MANSFKTSGGQGIAFFLAIFLITNVNAQDSRVDLLIQNARIVDGTGSPWFRSDIAIDEGRIVDIGMGLAIEARQTIDAAGRVIAPGFIDVHTHVESSESRGGLQNFPRADNYLLDERNHDRNRQLWRLRNRYRGLEKQT